jgi:all-trans-8'-apo-beta-carotenal 15,15'-oxygenase
VDLKGGRTAANWAGFFDTLRECDVAVTDIEGTLPDGLVGTLYRNGPVRTDSTASFFDGDGMIRAVEIGADGSVRYRARFVQTEKYLEERRSGRRMRRTAGTNLPGGVLRNAFRVPAHEANTSVFSFGGGLWALEEGGHPYPIDPRTLDTGLLNDFDGGLSRRTAFTAHPHIDPANGDTYAFGLHFGGPQQELRTFRVDARGGFHPIGRIPTGNASFVHDYGLSEKWMVFLIPPIVGRMLRFLVGIDSFFGSIEWRPELGTKVALMSRSGGDPILLETDTCMVGHTVAAWDVGDEVVVDICQLEDWAQMGDAAADFRRSDWAGFGASSVWRYRIDPRSRKVRREKISDMPAEFPEINRARECRGARYSYYASNRFAGDGGMFRGVLKLDGDTGDSRFFDFGQDKVSLQPTFVPHPEGSAEDDGWILTVVYNGVSHSTEIPILDARAVQDGPICTLRLHENAGTTFHGCWIAA